jgi:hypothetical protein
MYTFVITGMEFDFFEPDAEWKKDDIRSLFKQSTIIIRVLNFHNKTDLAYENHICTLVLLYFFLLNNKVTLN